MLYLLEFIEWESSTTLGVFSSSKTANFYRNYFIKNAHLIEWSDDDDRKYTMPDFNHYRQDNTMGQNAYEIRFRITELELNLPTLPVDNIAYLEGKHVENEKR